MNKICPVCQKEFYVKPSHYERRRCCSKVCYSEYLKTAMIGENNPNFRNRPMNICEYCKKEYKTFAQNRKYCSRECTIMAQKGMKRKPRSKETKPRAKRRWFGRNDPRQHYCKVCGVPIKCERVFCENCSPIHNSKIETVCKICGKKFIVYKSALSKKLTCSQDCSSTWQSQRQKGENSHLWDGGKTTISMIIRGSNEYSTWRRRVFYRDEYQCVMCSENGKLAAHHIKTFRDTPELRLDVDNGITLCWKCHGKIHGKEKEYEFGFTYLNRIFISEVK